MSPGRAGPPLGRRCVAQQPGAPIEGGIPARCTCWGPGPACARRALGAVRAACSLIRACTAAGCKLSCSCLLVQGHVRIHAMPRPLSLPCCAATGATTAMAAGATAAGAVSPAGALSCPFFFTRCSRLACLCVCHYGIAMLLFASPLTAAVLPPCRRRRGLWRWGLWRWRLWWRRRRWPVSCLLGCCM